MISGSAANSYASSSGPWSPSPNNNNNNNNRSGGGQNPNTLPLQPLATEGPWAAYLDTNYGRPYFFNHDTGESVWEPPTPTFPRVDYYLPQQGQGGEENPEAIMRDPEGSQGYEDGTFQQQQQQLTFYDVLQVPSNASRSQIKQSYLSLSKMYDARMEDGGRRSKEFNEIARAYMVLSDERSREKYDRRLEQWEAQRRMRMKMMEEERLWEVEQQQQQQQQEQMMMSSGREGGTINNKFIKDMIYKKKIEILDEDGSNKFGRFRGREVGPQEGEVGDGDRRSLDMNQEAERMQIMQDQMQEQEWQRMMMQQQVEEQAQTMRGQEEERMQQQRQEEMIKRQAQAVEEQKRKFDIEREREERRRASSERNVIQDNFPKQRQQQPMMQQPPNRKINTNQFPPMQGQDMNTMMENMKKNFSEKKMAEASRVKDELSSLGGGGKGSGGRSFGQSSMPNQTPSEQQSSSGKRRGVLFPGKGGIVVEDSPFIAKDVLLDEFLGRKSTTSGQPSFISWFPPEDDEEEIMFSSTIPSAPSLDGGNNTSVDDGQARGGPATLSGEREREQERLQNIRAKGGSGRQSWQFQPPGGRNQMKFGPSSPAQTSSKAREQERLQGMKAMGLGGGGSGRGGGQQSPPVGPTSFVTGERTAIGAEESFAKSSAKEREQRRLQDMKAAVGVGGMGVGVATGRNIQGPTASSAENTKDTDIRKMEEAHRAEIAKLKREMEELAAKTLEEEIVNIAKIHAAEIIKLRDSFGKSQAEAIRGIPRSVSPRQSAAEVEAATQQLKMNQAAERERMKEDITREVESAQAQKICSLEAAHKEELDKVLNQRSFRDDKETMRLQTEIVKLKETHSAELEMLSATRNREMQQLRSELETKTSEIIKAHQIEIQKLQQNPKAASVTDTLRFQKVAMDKVDARHKQEMQKMAAQHQREMENLRKELRANSDQDWRNKVDESKKVMTEQHKAEMELMAAQHKQEMQKTVEGELQNLKQQHAKEMEVALGEKRRIQQQAENVTRELKKAEQSGSTLTRNEKIDLVLRSFEGVYDPNLIKQLRHELNEREAGLNKQITESSQQIATLHSRLESSKLTEEKLTTEIKTLTQSKQIAESELESIKLGKVESSKEIIRLKECIQTMTKDISNLEFQLRQLMQERDSSRHGLQELTDWKTNAEAERTMLENELKLKDGFIAKLKFDLKERNEDVNVLVPEVRHLSWLPCFQLFNSEFSTNPSASAIQVARLQELTATLEDLNAKRSLDFEALKEEAARLKSQYEKESESAAGLAQSLKDQLTTEQLKNSNLIATLQDEIKANGVEMAKLQITASERSQLIAELRSKLERYRTESEKVIEDSKKKVASTDAFLRGQSGTIYSYMTKPSAGGVIASRPNTNVIGSNFSIREKNFASVRDKGPQKLSSATQAEKPPMTGWAGDKNVQSGGYLDILSAKSLTPRAQQLGYAVNQYRKAEKQLLLEAKSLSEVAAKSFEEARALEGSSDKKKYEETLTRAKLERARVDELFVQAAEMKAKAERALFP